MDNLLEKSSDIKELLSLIKDSSEKIISLNKYNKDFFEKHSTWCRIINGSPYVTTVSNGPGGRAATSRHDKDFKYTEEQLELGRAYEEISLRYHKLYSSIEVLSFKLIQRFTQTTDTEDIRTCLITDAESGFSVIFVKESHRKEIIVPGINNTNKKIIV